MRATLDTIGLCLVHLFRVRGQWAGQIFSTNKVALAQDPLNLLLSSHLGFSVVFNDAMEIEDFASASHIDPAPRFLASNMAWLRAMPLQRTILTVDELEARLAAGRPGWKRSAKLKDQFTAVMAGSYDAANGALSASAPFHGDVCTSSILHRGFGAYRYAQWLGEEQSAATRDGHHSGGNQFGDKQCTCDLGMYQQETTRTMPLDVGAAI